MDIFIFFGGLAFAIYVLAKMILSKGRPSPPPPKYSDQHPPRTEPQARAPRPEPKENALRTPPRTSSHIETSTPAVGRFDPEHARAAEPKLYTVSGRAYVIDGDTIRVQKTQIRLFGIDAPELNHPYGVKAKWAMVNLCKGQVITAEITAVDEYGRTVAKCTLPDGRDLSAEMVKQGMAIDWSKYSGGIYRSMETPDARKKLWLADARQKGRMHVWEKFEAQQTRRKNQ